MSAASVFSPDHLQGLEGWAIAFVWVPWLLVIQTENYHYLVFRPIANSICLPLLKLSSLRHWRTVCKVMSVFLELQMTSTVFPWRYQHRLWVLLRIALSTHSPKMNYLALPRLLNFKIKNFSFKEEKKMKRNTETLVKIGFTKVSLAAQKIWVAQNWEREGEGGFATGCYHLFLNQTHYSFSQICYHWYGSVFCTIIKCRQIFNTPPRDKFECNRRRSKRFILFWNGSNNLNTEIELRTNEHIISQTISNFFFSIFPVWSE